MMDEELKRRIALQTLKYIRDVAEYLEAKINDGWFLTNDAFQEITRLGDRACRTTQHDEGDGVRFEIRDVEKQENAE